MRWQIPSVGTVIVKRKFAFFPKVIGEIKIWLEYYEVQYQKQAYHDRHGKVRRKWVKLSTRLIEIQPSEERAVMGGPY